MVAERETKSVSVEGTYDTDLTDRRLMEGLLTRQAGEVAERLRKHGLSGRTVTIKVRLHDFTTLSRSTTLPSPHRQRRRPSPGWPAALLADLDTSGGVRLLGRRRLRAGRLDPGGPVRRDRADEPEDDRARGRAARRRAAPHLGARAWTSTTTRWAAAGCGARAAAW